MDALLYKSLDEGASLLCASQRLAHRLRLDFAHHAQLQGRAAWLTPDILTVNAFLTEAFARQRQHVAGPMRLLSELQTRTIWESIVADSDHALLSATHTARAALRSWQVLHQYRIPLEKLSDTGGEEAHAFHQWARRFVQYTAQRQLLDMARVPQWILHSSYVPDAALHVMGFDDVPPALAALLDHWRQHGCEVHLHEMPQQNVNAQVVALRNADAELEAAARWARYQLEHGQQRIGIVVPDLNVNATSVKRIFSAVLAPSSCSNQHENRQPFALSASADLASYPLVHHALLCLQLLQDRSDFACWEKILRSPFIAGHETESDERALLDIMLRESNQDTWSTQEVSHRALPTCPLLGHSLHAVAALRATIHGVQLPSTWTAHFNQALANMGWAKARTLSSDEQQVRNKFHEVLAQLSVLDEMSGRVNEIQALQLLRNACQQVRFAPETMDETITIIDADAAAGMCFDALWITGVHADAWPAAMDPDPFIPLHLQQQYGVPSARAGMMLQAAGKKLQRLAGSAAEVIMSWPQHDKDVELRPSSLLQWPVISMDAIPCSDVVTLVEGLIAARPKLERLSDIVMPAHPGGAIRQGARVFELQSRCAFRAQAELRLHAVAPQPLAFGISPLDRGKLIHAVLQELWNALRDSYGLRNALQSVEVLRTQVEQIAMRRIQHLVKATTMHQQRIMNVEVVVATNVIMQLLKHESTRDDFVVQSSEQREPFEQAGLKFNIQPDRIDRMADGSLLLIDYKTGDANYPQDWLDIKQPGRPRSPQLPLYALAHSQQLSGIAYAILSPGVAELRGLADRDDIAHGIRSYAGRSESKRIPDVDDWPQLLQHWRNVLSALATQFRQGVADVNPLPGECQYCTLTGMCRIKEQLLETDAEEEGDE